MNHVRARRTDVLLRRLLDRPVAISMAYGIVLAGGVYAFTSLPLELVPSTTYPALTIHARWETTSPEIMELFLTAPLEEIAGTIRGVHSVSSVSREGNSSVRVEFDAATNINFSRLELTEKLVSFGQHLPPGVSGPSIEQHTPEEFKSLQGFLSYSLTGKQSAPELRRYAEETVVPRLRSVGGVRTVEVLGGDQREIQIEFDPGRMKSLGLSVEQLTETVRHAGMSVPLGTVTVGSERHVLMIRNLIAGLADLRRLPVARTARNSTVRLADCAVVCDVPTVVRSISRVNGNPSVTIVIDREPGTNMLQVADQIRAHITGLSAVLPAGLEITSEIDQSRQLRKEIDRLLGESVASVVCIWCVLILFFGNLRLPLVVLSSILFSLAGTLLVLHSLGLGLNLVTMAGLVLGFGRLVDDSIVVMDNVQRHALDADTQTGILRAVKEIALPVVASTFTTIGALMPVVFLPTGLRDILADFAISVGVSLLFSLVASLTFIPAAMNRMALTRPTNGFLHRVGEKVGDMFGRILRGALRHRSIVLALTILVFGGSSYLFLPGSGSVESGVYGRETYLTVWAGFPQGSEIQRCDELASAIECEILRDPEGVRKLATQILDGVVRLRIDFHDSASYDAAPLRMKQRLTLFAARTGGAKTSVLGFGPGFSSGGESAPGFFVKISGYNYDRVKEIAGNVRANLEKNPRIMDVDVDGSFGELGKSFELALVTDRAAIARHGLTVSEVVRAIRMSAPGATGWNTLRYGGTEIPFVVKRAGYRDFSLRDLRAVTLTNATGTPVRLADLAGIDVRRAPVEIYRENRQYLRWLSFEYKGPYGIGARFVDGTIASMRLPAGYRIERPTSWQTSPEASGNSFLWIMGGALLLVFMVLASLYESFVTPLIVIVAIPFSFIGLMLAFLVTGTSFGPGGWAAALLLTGIVVTNSVVLVDYIMKQLHDVRMDTVVLVESATRRLKPVLMTTLATIGGLTPLLATERESSVWHSLALGTIGGLVSSTLLTLVIVPVVCATICGLTGERASAA